MPSESAMPQTWHVAPLSDLTVGGSVTYGVVQPGPHTPVGVPMLRVNNFQGFGLDTSEVLQIASDIESKYGRTRLQAHDVLLTIVGSVGQVAIVPKELAGWNIARAVALVRPKDVDMARWIALYLRSPAAQHALGVAANTTVQTTINLKDLKKLPIPIPPDDEREEITNTLSVLDDKIALLRDTNTTLEAIAQALFKSWFVDFDPVCAKAEGRDPEGVPPEVADLFPSKFEYSELGEIPKGWRVGKVSELGEVICGKTPPTSNPENYGNAVPFITIPDMHGMLVVTRTARYLSRTGADTQKNKYLPPGSVCVSCIATPGLVVRVVAESQTNQQINSVVPLKSWGHSFPLFLLRRIGDAVRVGGSGGSVFHNLNKTGFQELTALLPSSALAQAFDDVVEPLIEKITENQHRVQTIVELRDTLLPRLMSGKLHIPDLQESLP